MRNYPAGRDWWKASTVYQVYPRSFMDANGDGIGDIAGITSKVDYLDTLGVDIVWLSPVYQSPMRDNGYDIADYEAVDPMFGTMEDLDALIHALHERGMKLVMDLVVNHTSDQHPWFIESQDPSSPKRDWYIWRSRRTEVEPDEHAEAGQWRGDEPNQWRSAFSGPTWTWHRDSGEYYMHLFAPQQPDLNWENPNVRQAIYAMMRRWLERGVDGFRMDVINLISKPENLYEDGPGGLDRAMFGPHFHEYMAEMRREVFDAYPDRQFFTVGEAPGATPEQAVMTSAPERAELDMVFQFEHMGLDSDDGNKFHPAPLNLVHMKENLARWTRELSGRGWNSLYLSNHDQPRPVSRYGNDAAWRHRSATAWSAMLHSHQGTPFVYQGEELGMGNFPWEKLCEFNDLETLNYWRESVELGGGDPSREWDGIVAMSRDNARTPMQWSAEGGFSAERPWLPMNPVTSTVNAAAQVGVEGSTFEFFRRMIGLRKTMPVLVDGTFELLVPEHESVWWVRRQYEGVTLHAIANMSDQECVAILPTGDIILGNVDSPAGDRLQPWEVRWIIER